MSSMDMSVAGNEDRWMLLERVSSESLPLLVRTRINGLITEFATANCVTAIICDVYPQFVREDGFSTCLDQLHELEDGLIERVASVGARAYHTASVTGDGRRVLYFATAANFDFNALMTDISSPVASCSVFKDFDFETYSEFVRPTHLDVQFDGDRGLISSLAKHGDDGSSPRKIDFWFYGQREAVQSAVAQLEVSGFFVDHWLDEPVGVVLSLEAAADMRNFQEITPHLIETAAIFDIQYDGWETVVVSENAPQPPLSKPSLFGRLFGQKKH